KQKHTQWPGPMRTEHNVVGYRMIPNYMSKQASFSMIVFGVIALMSGLFQINPVWLFGPYQGAVVSSGSQPDWYVMMMDGMVRLFPPWEFRGLGHTIPAAFFPAVLGLGLVITLVAVYPFLERRFTKDTGHHNLLQRPRDVPARTGLGAMAIAFYMVMFLTGANDVIADKFNISLNAMTWMGRIGAIVIPAAAYYVTYRICLGLQQHDREVLGHGVETGIIRRLPNGKFVEVHQPLAEPDEHGHAELEYAGAPVPKKMNRLGALAPAVKGFFVPVEQPAPPPSEAPISPAPKREEITTGSNR
ncbi:MAG: cytochrome b N-terminal domain-containing protein, partial [Micromonosporaceae bacterium]